MDQNDHGQFNENELVIELYNQIKGYQKHEDNLIIARLGSLTLVSSFLFTGIAIISANLRTLYHFKLISMSFCTYSWTVNMYFGILFMFGLSGFSCSRFSLKGIRAARSAILVLRSKWNDVTVKYPQCSASLLLPDIVDGGTKNYLQNTDSNSIGIARILGFLWASLLLASILMIVAENFGYDFNVPVALPESAK